MMYELIKSLNDQNKSFAEGLAISLFEEMFKIFIRNPSYKGKLVGIAYGNYWNCSKIYIYFHCCSF